MKTGFPLLVTIDSNVDHWSFGPWLKLGSCDDFVNSDRRCCGGVDLKSSDDVSLLGQLTSLFVKSQAISSRRFESFQRSLRWRLDGLSDVFRSRSLLWMETGWFLSLYEAVFGQLHVT